MTKVNYINLHFARRVGDLANVVRYWAVSYAKCTWPEGQGQTLGYALNFAHQLVDLGADPEDVRELLKHATDAPDGAR